MKRVLAFHIFASKQKSSAATDLSKALRQTLNKKENAVQLQNFSQASELQIHEIKLLEEIRSLTQDDPAPRLSPVVSEADIAHIISSWTGIPVNKLTESESDQLLHMEKILHQRLIGQEEAVRAIARATRRARVGLQNPQSTDC